MEYDPGTFERIVETKQFHIKPAVLGRRGLPRFAFSDEISQYSDGSIDSDRTVRWQLYFHSAVARHKYKKTTGGVKMDGRY